MEPGAIICLIVCIVLSLTVILLLLSMDSLEPLQYGITLNKITKTIGTDVYENGRYFIGPFKTFLIYPSNLVSIEFSDSNGATGNPLQTRTAEGLGLTLSVSFQYSLNKSHIPDLYNLANINYQATFVRISRDVILKVAGMYNATNYWTDRNKIGEHMKQSLDKELNRAFAGCNLLEILRIDLPQTYEDSIVATQVEVQKTSMRKFEQTAELIRQNISVIVSEANQQIRVINATGDAEAYKIKQYAIAQAMNNTINAESEIYSQVQKAMTLEPTDLNEYVFLHSVMNHKDAKLLIGLQNSILNFGNQPVPRN